MTENTIYASKNGTSLALMLALTTQIISAYISKSPMPAAELSAV